MNRVEEIAAAMNTRPEPMFLFGLVELAKFDYDGVMSDLVIADRLVWAERHNQSVEESS